MANALSIELLSPPIAERGGIVLLVGVQDHAQRPGRLGICGPRLGGCIGLLKLLPNGRQKTAHLQPGQRVPTCWLEARVCGSSERQSKQKDDRHALRTRMSRPDTIADVSGRSTMGSASDVNRSPAIGHVRSPGQSADWPHYRSEYTRADAVSRGSVSVSIIGNR